MNAYKCLTFFMLLAAGFLPSSRACAQFYAEDSQGPHPGLSIGGRGAYYRTKGADSGDFAEGAQVRYHLTRRWALEGSVDLRKDKFGGTNVDVVPMQFSAIIYLMPHSYRLAPYILAGGGWYYTRVGAPADTSEFRFGPHAGGGAELMLNKFWSLDASYRYLWAEDIRSQDMAHPLGRNFSDKGFMLAVALNYYL